MKGRQQAQHHLVLGLVIQPQAESLDSYAVKLRHAYELLGVVRHTACHDPLK